MKVKVIYSTDEYRFEDKINEFIANHTVIDIKYQMSTPGHATIYSALIMYQTIKQ